MNIYKLIELLAYLTVLTLPLTYAIIFVYHPLLSNGDHYNHTKETVMSEVREHQPVSKREVSKQTNLSYMQTWVILTELSKNRKVVRCPDGIATACHPVHRELLRELPQ